MGRTERGMGVADALFMVGLFGSAARPAPAPHDAGSKPAHLADAGGWQSYVFWPLFRGVDNAQRTADAGRSTARWRRTRNSGLHAPLPDSPRLDRAKDQILDQQADHYDCEETSEHRGN